MKGLFNKGQTFESSVAHVIPMFAISSGATVNCPYFHVIQRYAYIDSLINFLIHRSPWKMSRCHYGVVALTDRVRSDTAVSELPEQTSISCRITIHNHQLPLLPTGGVTEIRFHKDPVAAVGY